MDLAQLQYFIRVAELDSISKAASELNVATSTVSNQIAALEQELGTPLFNRSRNNLSLNSNGKILYQYANRISNYVADAKKEVSDRNHHLDYELRIATMTIPRVIPHIIEGFRKQYPDIHPHVVQYQNYSNITELNCDVMIYPTETPVLSTNARVLYEEPIMLALSKNHPLASQKEIAASELAHEAFIRRSNLSNLRHLTDNYMKILGISPPTALVSDYPPFINQLIAQNMGIAFMPYLTWYYSPNEDIVMANILGTHFTRYINIAWRNDSYVSQACRNFFQYTTDFFNQLKSDIDSQAVRREP